jgi:hypothetical protein
MWWILGRDAASNPSRKAGQSKGKTSDSSIRSKLKLACGGDSAKVDRLIEFEMRKDGHISDEQAADRAYHRLVRDRGQII